MACILFAPIGVALGTTKRRGGRAFGFLLSVGLVGIYYLALFGGENLAVTGRVPPSLALWSGNMIFGMLGLIGLRERRVSSHWQDEVINIMVRQRQWWDQRKQMRRNRMFDHTRHARHARSQAHKGPRLVDRYITLTFLKYFSVSLSSLWLAFAIFTLFELSSEIIENRIPPRTVMSYLVFLSPSVIEYLTPPSILIASLLAFGLLTKTSETVALKAAGMSVYRMSLPVLITGLGLVLWTAAWQNVITPAANKTQDRLRYYIKHGHFAPEQAAWTSTLEGHWVFGQHNRVFHFRQFHKTTSQFRDLRIFDLDSKFAVVRRVEAALACWDVPQQKWILHDARVWEFLGEKVAGSHRSHLLPLGLEETPAYFQQEIKKPEFMSKAELRHSISVLEQSGLDVTELRVALAQRVAFPFTCLVMALVGIPFGFTLGRKGALVGIGFGLVLGLLYWMGLGLFGQLGRYEYVSVWLAGWSLNGLFGVVGLYVLFRWRS
jgi:LPS export ABC transporter permease LptG